MKKWITLTLALAMVLCLAACGTDNAAETTPATTTAPNESVPAATGNPTPSETLEEPVEDTIPAYTNVHSYEEMSNREGLYILDHVVSGGETIDSAALAEMEYYAYIQMDPDGYGSVNFGGDQVTMYWSEEYLVAENVPQQYYFEEAGIIILQSDDSTLYFYRTDYTAAQ